ncbi:signal peptidase I [Clostridioides difficile DA00142]|uniref:signal peptidase I n=1 Tax=Clostridioides difficile TaxID=1496 RepID=UPI00038CA545|nr:signal peptidase I [Clostridioides difficile]EQG70276.1 signal peptidase I [Clostridioides difficile DA00142]
MGEAVKKEVVEWIKVIVIALVLAFAITRFIVPTIVKGESMYPTLVERDYLIVNRIAYKVGEPKYKDIIVFKTDLTEENGKKKDLVKRVIGVPGDHVKIQDSKVYVNDKLLDETSYIHNNRTDGDIDIVVPEGKLFAMGDNREKSLDSRYDEVGLVDEHTILGKFLVRLYPFSKIGTID